jgi:CHAD domain-containing protein
MAYRFEADERVREAFRRCSDEQLQRAEKELREGIDENPVKAVHAARKAVKKERALLRLGLEAIGKRKRRNENVTLRDAARRLSTTRDAEVLVQAMDSLSDRFAGQIPETTFSAFRERLEARRDLARAELNDPELAPAVAAGLSSARSRIGRWRLKASGWDAIGGGLVRTYRQGRKAFRRVGAGVRAEAGPEVEHLHEWRKRAKDLWYELRLLGPVCGPAVRGQAKEAHRLSDLLGDDHDLAVLRQTLIELGHSAPADLEAVLGLIDHRRQQLQAQAIVAGERVYAENAKAFDRRIRRYWKAGRAQIREVRSRDPEELAQATRVPVTSQVH